MSDPLSTRTSSFYSNNNLQPIPDVLPGSGEFGRHRVNIDTPEETGWLNAADDMPGAAVSATTIPWKNHRLPLSPTAYNH